MNNSEPYASAYLKLKRADKHIYDLENSINQFFNSDVYALVVESDMENGDRLLKIRLKVRFPSDDFSLIVGDVLHNMRSALDHMVGYVAKTEKPDAKRIEFPFAGDIKKFRAKGTQVKLDKLPDRAKRIIEDLKPYQGGNDLLWAISRLRNDDTHNFLNPCATFGHLAHASNLKITRAKIGLIIGNFQSLEEGVLISNLGTEGTFEGNPNGTLKVSGQVLFGDVDVVQGQEVITTLKKMHGITFSTLETFREEFFA